MRRFLLLIFFQVCWCVVASAQESRDSIPQKKNTLFTKKNAVITALTLQQIGSFYIEYKWWWEGNSHPFVIYSDEWFQNYSLGMDKAGHFYISYMYFHSINELMKWADFKEKTRLITSIALPAAYALSIEIGDGFSTYNFSPQDLVTNLAGIGYGLLQEKVPYFQNINFKMSYFPSTTFSHNNYKGWSLTEDYDGHIYWITFNVHHMLPKAYQKYWPEFLNIGGGYSVTDFRSGPAAMKRDYIIGLDYNLGAIKIKNRTLHALRNIADKIHFPAPGIKQLDGESFKPSLFLLR